MLKTIKRRLQRKRQKERIAKRKDWLKKRRQDVWLSWLERYKQREQ